MSSTVTVHLKKGRDRQIAQGHPWLFSGAIQKVDGCRDVGATANVLAADGTWLGRGVYHPDAQLGVRIYTRNEKHEIDAAFFEERISRAMSLRDALFVESETNAYRLVFSEADGLSGLMVDRYNDIAVIEIEAVAWLPYLRQVCEAVKKHRSIQHCVVRAHADAVRREGLDPARVASFSDCSTEQTSVRENGYTYDVRVTGGQKTGFYVDQRENRLRVARYAQGRSVLSAYCYTGAFEVHAGHHGATRIMGLDTSEPALDQAKYHCALNNVSTPVEYNKVSVPVALRTYRDSRVSFGMIILDPPRFVASRAQLDKGLRAYKDINLLAMKLLESGGILATFSCSGLVSAEAFSEAIRWAANDSGKSVQILETLGQPADHPILIGFPESAYLKGLICRVE